MNFARQVVLRSTPQGGRLSVKGQGHIWGVLHEAAKGKGKGGPKGGVKGGAKGGAKGGRRGEAKVRARARARARGEERALLVGPPGV